MRRKEKEKRKWIEYSRVQNGAEQSNTVITVHYSPLQYTTVQYTTVQYSTLQYSTLQYTTVHYSTLQYGLVKRVLTDICKSIEATFEI